MIVIVLAVDYLFQSVFALKWAYRHHFILAVVVGLFPADVAFAKFTFSTTLVMNTKHFLSILV